MPFRKHGICVCVRCTPLKSWDFQVYNEFCLKKFTQRLVEQYYSRNVDVGGKIVDLGGKHYRLARSIESAKRRINPDKRWAK